jgi:mRNA interferase RelE/StbE
MGMGIDQINEILKPFHVEVYFTKESLSDLNSYDKNEQEKIIAMIIKRGMRGPLIKPRGIGEPLRNELKGFTKIKGMTLRIVYRPVESNGVIRMEIIAIGPRDREKVYRLAAKRLQSFDQQMDRS